MFFVVFLPLGLVSDSSLLVLVYPDVLVLFVIVVRDPF